MSDIDRKYQDWSSSESGWKAILKGDTLAAWRAAYEAGEIAMKEKAYKLAADLWDADDNHCVEPICYGLPAAIRALPLSGAEEAKK